MATTNLTSQSLGGVLVQSGNGTPDHTAPRGSLYTDQDTGVLYQNQDGSTGWSVMSTTAYGEMYLVSNATSSAISSTGTWFIPTGLSFTQTDWNGVPLQSSPNDYRMEISTGRGGLYRAAMSVSIDANGLNGDYELGLSINDTVPNSGDYNGVTVNATTTTATATVHSILNLSDADTVAIAYRNNLNTNDILIVHVNLVLVKVQ